MATIRRKKSESFAILSSPGPWPQVLINWLATLAVIIVFGLIMLFSASYTTGYLRMGDSFYYIKSQVFCLGLGLAVMLLFSRIDHRFLRRMVGPGYVVCIVMLIAVLFSAPLNGCRRWLRIGFTIQVSEIAKFEMILLTAHLAAKAPHLEKLDPASGRRVPAGQWLYQRIVRELIVPLLPLIPVVFLLMLEPHMSGIVLTTAICGTILLLGGSGGIITWAGGALMGVARTFLEVLKTQVFGGRAHAERFAAAVDGVGTIIDRSFQAAQVAGRRQHFGLFACGDSHRRIHHRNSVAVAV